MAADVVPVFSRLRREGAEDLDRDVARHLELVAADLRRGKLRARTAKSKTIGGIGIITVEVEVPLART